MLLEGPRTIAGEKGTVTERSFVMVRILLPQPNLAIWPFVLGLGAWADGTCLENLDQA